MRLHLLTPRLMVKSKLSRVLGPRRRRQGLEASLGYIVSFSQHELHSKTPPQTESEIPKSRKVNPETLKHELTLNLVT